MKEENIENFRIYQQGYREKNAEKERERVRDWIEKNREKKNESNKRHYRAKNKAKGSHSVFEWQEKIIQYSGRCAYCGKIGEALTEDHIIPLSRGGTDFIDNIVPACHPCNSSKHNSLVEEWFIRRPEMKNKSVIQGNDQLISRKPTQNNFAFVVQLINPYDVITNKRTLVSIPSKESFEKEYGRTIKDFTKVGEIYGVPILQFIPEGTPIDFKVS